MAPDPAWDPKTSRKRAPAPAPAPGPAPPARRAPCSAHKGAPWTPEIFQGYGWFLALRGSDRLYSPGTKPAGCTAWRDVSASCWSARTSSPAAAPEGAGRAEEGRAAASATTLTKLGFIEESELTNFLSKQYGVPAINLKDFDIDREVVKLVPKEVAEKHQCIPVNRAGSSLIVAMGDPSNIYAIDDIKFLTGYNIELGGRLASRRSRRRIEKYYAEKGPSLRRGDGGLRRRARSTSSTTTRTQQHRRPGEGARRTRRSSSW